MRRLRALIRGLPPDAAVHRHQAAEPIETTAMQRRSSSLDTIRRIGGKVIEIHREAG